MDKAEAPLDALRSEAEKLLKLLEDPQPGMMTWHMFLGERIRAIHALTSHALGI